VRRAGVEVAVDFGEAEVVKLAALDRQRHDELAGVACQQPCRLASPRTPESAALALLMVLAEIVPAC